MIFSSADRPTRHAIARRTSLLRKGTAHWLCHSFAFIGIRICKKRQVIQHIMLIHGSEEMLGVWKGYTVYIIMALLHDDTMAYCYQCPSDTSDIQVS